MKHFLLLVVISFCSLKSQSQIPDLFKSEGFVNDLHKMNAGKIIFTNGNIALDTLNSADFLDSFNLTRKSDLNIRVYMNNSVFNYLHQLAPGMSTDNLIIAGNLQFTFYLDTKLIYKENIHHGCNFGSGGNKKTSTTFRVPLTSSKGEDWWAMYMWDRFKMNGGEELLTPGIHKFKLEIRPYVNENSVIKVGDLIAEGQVFLVIKSAAVTAAQIAIQPIAANSGWEISDLPFDKKKIEQLNTEIAKYNLKEITSVVVIHEGKLMLEEYFNDATRTTLHDSRSAGKSFASTFMGMAIHEGYIKNENQTLSTFYNLKKYTHYEAKKDSIKIKDLLTMSSAFEGSDAHSESPGNEENMYPSKNWVKFTLDLPMDSTKTNGKQWDYFTAGVVPLGDILDKKVPGGLEKYASEKLFKPLGITSYKWQYTPQKVVNTAGSLQMRSLDYAKYIQVYKNNGVWNGQQLITSEWVQKTLTPQIQIPGRNNEFYSYLFWNKKIEYSGKNYEIFYCAGNGGNEFIIFKDLPLTLIITSTAYNKPYGHKQAETIVRDYLLPAILR